MVLVWGLGLDSRGGKGRVQLGGELSLCVHAERVKRALLLFYLQVFVIYLMDGYSLV